MKRWKWTGHVVPLLVQWVQQWWEDGERGERAWEAILLLLQAGEHGPVGEIIAGTFQRTDDRAIPWDRDFFTLIAEADPKIEGLADGLVDLGLRNPERIGDVVPALTVASVFVLRRREPDIARPYRTWGYPWPPLIYLVLSAWSLTFMLLDRPMESLAGLATLALGLVLYAIDRVRARAVAPAR